MMLGLLVAVYRPAPPATQAEGITDLRLLVELSALRTLAERGLSDKERSTVRALADATMRSARSGDVFGYLRADMAFHLYLVDLAADAELSEVARLVLAATAGHAQRVRESGQLMAAGAREHRELIDRLADDRVRAAEDLLRNHICAPTAARSAFFRGSLARDPLTTRAT
jgi:DNA-binding GntR family transcriptional regulator